MPAQNSFTGAHLDFQNVHIHFMLAEIIKFRKQLTVRSEKLSQSGWDNALNHYMVKQLEQLADTLENVTYHPGTKTQEELESEASDTTSSLSDKYDVHAVSADDVLMPVSVSKPVVWDLSGGNNDIPQMDQHNCPNDFMRAFIQGLDGVFVELTRLDCRHQSRMIPKYQSVMVHSLLNELYTITQRKGGEANRSDTPQGTMPSQEEVTFKG